MEPRARDDRRSSLPPREPPKTSIPMTIGILNIIFSSVLLMCLFCSMMGLFLQGPMMAVQKMQQQQIEQAMKADRQKRLQQLQEDLEKAANNEKEKAELKARQKALEAQPVPKMPDMNKFTEAVQNKEFTIADVASGIFLNVLMLISGIAFCFYKEWGRQTAIWVAVLKIVRLIVLYTSFAVLVVPTMVTAFNAMFQEMFEEMAKAAPPGQKMPVPPADQLEQVATLMGIGMTVTAVGIVIFGVIYPIIVLILLTRPRIKAACKPKPATKKAATEIEDDHHGDDHQQDDHPHGIEPA